MSQTVFVPQPTDVNRAYPARLQLLWVVAVSLGVSFFLAEHSLQPEGPRLASEASQELSRSRQVGIVSVGLLGCLLISARGGQSLSFDNNLARLVLAFAGLCFASVLWTEDVSFTVRRLGSLFLCFAGVLGLCRQLRPSDLCKVALVISCAFLCVGVGMEILGRGHVTSVGRYRFGGTVNPNLQGTYCAIICLASACLHSGAVSRRWVLRGIFVLGFAFLLLTGSRTALYSFFAAIAANWWLVSKQRDKALVLTGIPLLLTLFVVLYELFAGAFSGSFLELVTIGRDVETVSTMTGRVPIWNELLGYARQRPLLGYGYQGFWAGDRLLEMSDATGWAARGSHNAYLETVLNVGLIGGVLFVLAISTGVVRARRYFLQTADAGYGFIVSYLVFGAVHSFAEGIFSKPALFPSMIFFCALSMLAFQRDPSEGLRHGRNGKLAA